MRILAGHRTYKTKFSILFILLPLPSHRSFLTLSPSSQHSLWNNRSESDLVSIVYWIRIRCDQRKKLNMEGMKTSLKKVKHWSTLPKCAPGSILGCKLRWAVLRFRVSIVVRFSESIIGKWGLDKRRESFRTDSKQTEDFFERASSAQLLLEYG